MAAIQTRALPARRLGRLVSGRVLLLATATLAGGFAVLQINQFSRVTSTGYAITRLEQQRAAKQAEVHELEAEVAALSSLARVDWEARTRLHMEPARQRLYLQVNQPVPEHQTLPTRFIPTKQAQDTSAQGEPSWRNALKALPFF